MANVLVYIETDGERPSHASLQALGEGRRIASTAGATLYALVTVEPPKGTRHTELIATLGQAGADRVVLRPRPAPSAPTLWATVGEAIYASCEQIAPSTVLLPGSAGGHDIGPRLAARLGAAYVAEPSIQRGPRGELVLSRAVYAGTSVRRLIADELERPVVVTLTPGSYLPAKGDEEPGVLPHHDALDADEQIEPLATEADPGSALSTARVVVTAGGGVRTASDLALVEELARALGAEVGATRAVCARGLAPAEREIGVGARHVSPLLYVVCAASGSQEHLAAVSSDAEIVAINRDADAPIFQVATYGIVGELAEVLPQMIDALRASAPVAASP